MIIANPSLLDVRPVEPKDRFDTIMGAYDQLAVNATVLLTVDHDPTCLYYTLKALHGPETFNFRYLENGPEIWRVALTRLGR